jgi:predicted nucleic acid-binding protein
VEALIIIADAGPLLHLYWVDALSWALLPMEVLVPRSVVAEVAAHTPGALADSRLIQVEDPEPAHELSGWSLDAGEQAALSLALAQPSRQTVRLLCDDMRARAAADEHGLESIGTVGLILRARAADRVGSGEARKALLDLRTRGRMHLNRRLLQMALEELEQDAD